MGLRAVAMATVGALMRYAASRLCARLLAGLWSACGRNREGGRSSHHLSAVHPDSAREWVSPFQDGQEAWDSSGLAAGLDDDVESPKSLFVATAEWPRRNLVSFSIYAACRLFDTTPDVTEGIKYFEAIRTLAGMYLRADTVGMAETLQAYGLDTLMQKHTRFVAMLGIIQDLAAADGELGRRANSNFSSKRLCPFGRKSLRLDSARPAASEASSRGATVCRPVTMEQMLMVLMWELEGLLFDYLAQHWHKLDDMLTVNKLDVQGDGMACARIPRMTDLALAPVHPQRQAAAMCAPHGSLAYSVEGNDDECCVLGPEADDNTIVLGNHLCLGCQDRAIANWQRARKAAMRHKVQQLLGTQRELKTMEHLFKELHKEDPEDLHVQGPRQPTVLLLGGGMAAGKSTVREIVGSSTFWSKVGAYAVMVEADAIKGQDPVFKTLSEMKEFAGDQSKLSAFVHEYSTRQAENLLVAAVNQQKDVIMDATMMHAPFVEQTISMIRDHHNQYKRGAGYQEHEDGIVTEEYWVVDDSQQHVAVAAPRPYRIEVIGVTCDPSLAVARGVLRFLRTSRGVPLRSQLRSHRLFAQNWESYAALVDSATLYHTGNALMTMGPEQLPTPKVIAHKSDATRGDMLVNPEAYAAFRNLKHIDDDAESLADLQRSLSISPSARGGLSACPCSDESRLGFLRGCLL